MALEAFINGDKQKTAKKRGRTLRFELELVPSTEEFTNEFSYTDLVDGEVRKVEGRPKVGDTLEKGPDNQLAALAQRLEEKYGAPSPKKRKKQRVLESDLIDRGRGYDTNDSFVDDSELYEDFVPPQVDTKFGGFYINTGDLEFKTAQDMEDMEDEEMDFLVRKKKKPKMKKQSSHQTPQSILASQKLKKAKLHVAAQKVPKPKSLFKTSSTMTSVTSTATSPSVMGKPLNKKLTATVKKKGETNKHGLLSSASISSILEGDSNGGVSWGGEEGGERSKKVSEGSETVKPPPVLPGDLPEDIATAVKHFEESVARDQASTPEGKISVKTRCSYDDKLTELELACRKLQMKKRIAVLEYVSHKLGVSRATTIKRIRQVMKKREEEALAQPLQRLEQAVTASMPEQLQQYEQELKARADSLSTGEKQLPVAHIEAEDDNTADEVFDESSNMTTEAKDAAKSKRAPRKKYRWNDETRRLVCEVVKVKVESEEMMRGRSNGEEVLMEFLDARVKPIWPKGWMQKSILYKTTESVHRHFTNPQSRKVTPAGKRGEKGEQKKELESSPSQTILSATANQPPSKKSEPREPSPLTEPSRAGGTAHKAKDEVEKVQWSVRSTGTSNGSPITILTKKVTTSIASSMPSVSSGVASTSTAVHITPRMAQLLSSVASSQALVKSSKAGLSSASKSPSQSASASSSKTDKQQFTLHSEVQALLSKFQSSQTATSVGSSQTPSVISSGTHPPVRVSVPSLTQSAVSAGRGVATGAGNRGGGKIISPKSKITTSPIQMKAIVSQLKPKTSSQGKLVASKPPNVSSSSVSPLVKVKKVPVGTSAGPALKTPPTPGLHAVVGRPSVVSTTATSTHLPLVSFPSTSTSTSSAGNKHSQGVKHTQSQHTQGVKHTQSQGAKAQTLGTRVSPPKAKSMSHASQHTPVSMKRPDHSKAIRVGSTSPLSNSTSSSSSSLSSTSPQPHLLLSVVQKTSPPLPPSSSPPLHPSPSPPPASSSSRPPSLVATGALSGSSLYPSSALEGTTIVLKKRQQQPTTVRQPPQLQAANTATVRQPVEQQPVAIVRQPIQQANRDTVKHQQHPVTLSTVRQPGQQQPAITAVVNQQQHPASLSVRQPVRQQPANAAAVKQQVQPVLTTSAQSVIVQQQLAAMSTVRPSVQLHQPVTITSAQQPSATISTVKQLPHQQLATMSTNTAAATSRQQMEQQHINISTPNTDFLAQIAATTLPFSSCASAFVPASPLPQFTLHSSTFPHAHHQTPAVRPPNISLPQHPAQVLVSGISGTGVKSPVEQIYLEHSYGGQTMSDSAPEVRGNVPVSEISKLQQ